MSRTVRGTTAGIQMGLPPKGQFVFFRASVATSLVDEDGASRASGGLSKWSLGQRSAPARGGKARNKGETWGLISNRRQTTVAIQQYLEENSHKLLIFLLCILLFPYVLAQ